MFFFLFVFVYNLVVGCLTVCTQAVLASVGNISIVGVGFFFALYSLKEIKQIYTDKKRERERERGT